MHDVFYKKTSLGCLTVSSEFLPENPTLNWDFWLRWAAMMERSVQQNTSNWSTYIIWRTLIQIWLTSFEKPNISFRKPILSLETQITPLGNQISSPVQVLNLPIAYWTMLAFHLVLLDHWHHSHSLASYRVNFCVHISSVTLYLIKGLLYQETERWENLREKGPRTRKPFAAHSRVVSSFLPHRLWILI